MSDVDDTSHGYVEIPEDELSELRIGHLASDIDMSIALPEKLAETSGDLVTGFTEWSGSWSGTEVSIGWDWALIREQVVLLSAVEIRTNIRLVTADGSALSPVASRARIAQWLDSLPWREMVTRSIAPGRA